VRRRRARGAPALPGRLLAQPAAQRVVKDATSGLASSTTLPRAPESIDSVQFRGMQWRNVGPNRGGRSIAVSGSVQRPLEYWFGAVGGGAWKTTDGGTSWAPMTDGQLRSSSVGAIAVAPSNPDVVWLGMGETCLRGNIMQGDGVYRSTDGGKTWTHLGLAETHAISKIRVHPTNPDIAWVAAFGHPAGPNPERGVYKTVDGGRRGAACCSATRRPGRSISPSIRRTPTCSSGHVEAYRITWQMSSGGAGSGLFRSTDGGETWTELTRAPGLPKGVVGRIGVSVSPADGRRVYAAVEAADGGIYRSDDAGATWARTSDERKLRQRAFYYTHITADPQLRDRVYVLNVGLFRSDDGGARFDTTIAGPHSDHHDLWIAPNDNRRMAEANDGGGTVSVNAGPHVDGAVVPHGAAVPRGHHARLPVPRVRGAAGQQHRVPAVARVGQPARRQLRAAGRLDVRRGRRGERPHRPRPARPERVLRRQPGRAAHALRPPQRPDPRRAGVPALLLGRAGVGAPRALAVDLPDRVRPDRPAHALRVVAARLAHARRGADVGPHLARPHARRPRHARPDGGPITQDMNGPRSTAPSSPSRRRRSTRRDLGRLGRRAGARDARRRAHVGQRAPAGAAEVARISMIDASAHAPGTAYLAAKHYLQDDRAPYVYRTQDYGRTWTRIVGGIRADDYVHVVREDPTRAGLLYVGTEHGVYVSWDDGASWRSLRLNLPDVQVSDLVVHGADLVIATHGRSMYVLDDVTTIRAAGDGGGIGGGGAAGVDARAVVRGVDEGALIQYVLSAPADTVRVEILDASGRVIRTYVGGGARRRRARRRSRLRRWAAVGRGWRQVREGRRRRRARRARRPARHHPRARGVRDAAAARRPGGRAADGAGRAQPDDVGSALDGGHRLPCMIIWSAQPESGPLAVPGGYQVRVTRQRGERDAPARAAARLAARGGDRGRPAGAVRPGDAHPRSGHARQRGGAPHPAPAQRDRRPRGARGGAVADARGEVAAHPAPRARGGALPGAQPERAGSAQLPIKLNNRLASLGRSVQTGDARPTDASHVVFRELTAELDDVLRRLDAVVAGEVRAFDREAGTRGLPAVVDASR
jgi:photosystem II stability/assembly factor-like uncharacterized protein